MSESRIKLPYWKPKQRLIWESTANELLIAGDTRAGKSFFIRKAYILWASQIPGLQLDILRLNYDDVINNYMNGETSFPQLLRQWEKDKLVKINEDEILWQETGSRISLGHCADDKIARKHQGNAVHVRTLDESAQLPELRIRGLAGWITLSEEMLSRIPEKWRGQFPKFFHLTNFMGPGMAYYRRGFLEPRQPFEIEQVGQFRRQYIPMYLTDNDSEDAQRTIARIKEAFPDPAAQKALLECNWRALIGDFFTEWNERRHVTEDFIPPKWWVRYRAFDWGTAEPFCVYWIAISDGQQFIDEEGRKRWFPRGALVYYREWYGCDKDFPAKGNRMRNEDIANGILERSEPGFEKVDTVTDSLPFQDRGGMTIARTFQLCGVPLILGDTSRVPGWSQVRSRLIGYQIDSNVEERIPMIYFTECCSAARTYIPMLQRHKSESKGQDAVEHGEATHSCDTIRLGCMVHPFVRDEPKHKAPQFINEATMDTVLSQHLRLKKKDNGLRR